MRLHQLLTGLVITIVAACGNSADDGSVATGPAPAAPPGVPSPPAPPSTSVGAPPAPPKN